MTASLISDEVTQPRDPLLVFIWLARCCQCKKQEDDPKQQELPSDLSCARCPGHPSRKDRGWHVAERCREQSELISQTLLQLSAAWQSSGSACEPDFFLNPKGTYCNLDLMLTRTLMTAAMFLILLAL